MTFCRVFGMSPREYRAQPAREIMRWQQMLEAEREGLAMRARIEQARARAKR